MKLVIIIPAYNEEGAIRSVLKSIPKEIAGIDKQEVLVIDDGSTDATARVSRESGVEVISHLENMGLGQAFATGVKNALIRKADIMVVIDGDGQFHADDIPRLIQPIVEKKADFVSGSRFAKDSPQSNIPRIRLVGNRVMANFLSLMSGRKFSDVSCGFRAYSRETLLHLNLFGKFTYTQETILNIAYKGLVMTEVPVHVTYFKNRKSQLTGSLKTYVLRSSNIVFRTVLDYRPLAVFGGTGIVVFGLGVILDVVMVGIFLETGRFTPNASIGIAGLVLNFFGLLLFIIGLIGDMLNRIRRNQERILYYEKRKLYGE